MKKISLSAAVLAATLAVPSFAGPGLADGAAKFVGNITQSDTAPGANDQFTKLWNQATAENGCKWGSVEGSRGNYNWVGCDAAYKWAKNNGGYFKFHALLWGSQYPSWLGSLNATETEKAITAWFDAVAARYPDADLIDVANEAIWSGNNYHSNYKNTKIIEALGGDNVVNGQHQYNFLVKAFQMARKRWPNAILIYNDYNTIQWQRDEGIQLIQALQKQNAPIDAYGLQAHDLQSAGGNANGTGGGGSCLNYNQFKSTMETIHEGTNNIPIYISEYDIATTDDAVQKQCYQEQISYWMEDQYVAGITLWGYIYGQTWTNDGKGYSGIIRNGQDRPAMTWLKEYLAKNKGVNETGLTGGAAVPPEPQTPFGGKAAAIPGKIEAENFDVPGKGRNEDGTNNQSYSVANSGNGNSDYRKGESPNLYKNATGVVIGYNNTDNWYEYTVEVAETGTYTMFAAVASAAGGAFTLSMDGKNITESIAVPAAKSGEDTYDEYAKVSAEVNLTKGKHIMRLTVDKEYFDIDYITFVAGAKAVDPEPIDGEVDGGDKGDDKGDDKNNGEVSIAKQLQYDANTLQHYSVFDMNGMFMGNLSGYGFDMAIETVRHGNVKFAAGVYTMRNRYTGAMKSFTVEK